MAKVLGSLATGYTIAVLAGAAIYLLVIGLILNDLMILFAYPLVALVMASFALPGFILLRALLYWANVSGAFGFAVAGMANATLLPIIDYITGGREPAVNGLMLAALAAAGAASGAVYSVLERRLVPKKGVSA